MAESNNISRLFGQVKKSLGPVDILINNAAFWEPDSLESITPKSHDKHFAINSRAAVLIMAEYFKRY
ncbi:MAG: SDR family NAD(P)-dependent oxidoreductase, partial [Planctomycetota bacterium]